jgi:hypothetical protein
MTPEEKYRKLYEQMYKLCQKNNWGDPFSYSRGKEIYMATVLNHKVAETYTGADAYDEDGACEYKSTISDEINATYNGISIQSSIEEQIKYLESDKIGAYHNHYFSRFDGGHIAEIYVMSSETVLELLVPKVKKQYPKKKSGNLKDPRIGVGLSGAEIRAYGKKIYG